MPRDSSIRSTARVSISVPTRATTSPTCSRASLAGEDVAPRLDYYNEQYPVTYRLWFETLYKDKYFYMGDAELMSAALLLDVGSYFVGLVTPVYKNPSASSLTCRSKERRAASSAR